MQHLVGTHIQFLQWGTISILMQKVKALVIRFGGTEKEEELCCVVGTGAKIWTFSQSVGRKVSSLGVIYDEEGKKSLGIMRRNP